MVYNIICRAKKEKNEKLSDKLLSSFHPLQNFYTNKGQLNGCPFVLPEKTIITQLALDNSAIIVYNIIVEKNADRDLSMHNCGVAHSGDGFNAG